MCVCYIHITWIQTNGMVNNQALSKRCVLCPCYFTLIIMQCLLDPTTLFHVELPSIKQMRYVYIVCHFSHFHIIFATTTEHSLVILWRHVSSLLVIITLQKSNSSNKDTNWKKQSTTYGCQCILCGPHKCYVGDTNFIWNSAWMEHELTWDWLL